MSLKDKRRALRSVKDRLAHRHNISIAETDWQDEHRRAELGIAMVANDARFVESCLSKIVDEVRVARHVSLIDYEIEWA
ncbi:MAG: DUF503 domain-containing protein [Phycisphaerae bacterium]|nr:DUF503 domain-containing protein [Phycisphaerae bacterium]